MLLIQGRIFCIGSKHTTCHQLYAGNAGQRLLCQRFGQGKQQELVVKEGKELMTMEILKEMLSWDHDALISVLYI
jgi:hypothetical protein